MISVASFYEFGGLLPFYATDLGNHLRGWDVTCSNYSGTPWYNYIALITVGMTLIAFSLQYYVIDSARFVERKYTWIFAGVLAILSFGVAFVIPYNDLSSNNICKQLHVGIGDCVGFGFSNAIWSFLLFAIITSIPWTRKFSTNSSLTTLWRPKRQKIR